jgi:hypothetical protein
VQVAVVLVYVGGFDHTAANVGMLGFPEGGWTKKRAALVHRSHKKSPDC